MKSAMSAITIPAFTRSAPSRSSPPPSTVPVHLAQFVSCCDHHYIHWVLLKPSGPPTLAHRRVIRENRRSDVLLFLRALPVRHARHRIRERRNRCGQAQNYALKPSHTLLQGRLVEERGQGVQRLIRRLLVVVVHA